MIGMGNFMKIKLLSRSKVFWAVLWTWNIMLLPTILSKEVSAKMLKVAQIKPKKIANIWKMFTQQDSYSLPNNIVWKVTGLVRQELHQEILLFLLGWFQNLRQRLKYKNQILNNERSENQNLKDRERFWLSDFVKS